MFKGLNVLWPGGAIPAVGAKCRQTAPDHRTQIPVSESSFESRVTCVYLRSRVHTRHVLTNTSSGYRTEQVIRVDKPSLVTSGAYTCKVATFTSEMIASHSLLIFGELGLVTPETLLITNLERSLNRNL